MAASSTQIEGLKLINHWCKWIVTIEIAGIAIIGAMAKETDLSKVGHHVRIMCAVSVFSFICSTVIAAVLLSAIPTSMEDIKPTDKIWDRFVHVFRYEPCSFTVAGHALGGLFLLGLVTFALAVVFQLYRY